VGATIATLLIGGNATVGGAWGSLKPAHAWLNLVGFAGLVFVASLLHLAQVAGTRMRPRASGRIAVLGVAIGAPLVALGYAHQVDAALRLALLNVGALVVTFASWPLAGTGSLALAGASRTPAGAPLVAIGLGLAAAGVGASLVLLGLAAVRRPAGQPVRLAGV